MVRYHLLIVVEPVSSTFHALAELRIRFQQNPCNEAVMIPCMVSHMHTLDSIGKHLARQISYHLQQRPLVTHVSFAAFGVYGLFVRAALVHVQMLIPQRIFSYHTFLSIATPHAGLRDNLASMTSRAFSALLIQELCHQDASKRLQSACERDTRLLQQFTHCVQCVTRVHDECAPWISIHLDEGRYASLSHGAVPLGQHPWDDQMATSYPAIRTSVSFLKQVPWTFVPMEILETRTHILRYPMTLRLDHETCEGQLHATAAAIEWASHVCEYLIDPNGDTDEESESMETDLWEDIQYVVSIRGTRTEAYTVTHALTSPRLTEKCRTSSSDEWTSPPTSMPIFPRPA